MTDEQNRNIAYNIAWYLHSYGIRDIVVSPGSRNAAIIDALANGPFCFKLHYVVDERQAAFTALGIVVATHTVVAMVCTSGSAVFNYAPALAEAYYSRIPLVAITADRPLDVIDQRDSQTIRQAHALDAVVRRSVDIADDMPAPYVRRLIQDALNAAGDYIPGPVHINVRLHQPMAELRGDAGEPVMVMRHTALPDLDDLRRNALSRLGDRILIIIGGMYYDRRLHEVLCTLRDNVPKADCDEKLGNVAIVAEVGSNVGKCADIMAGDFETAIAEGRLNDLMPDTVVIMGGALVSAGIKRWLRELPESTHVVNVGYDDIIVDTFGRLTDTVECTPTEFFICLDNPYTIRGDYRSRIAALPHNIEHPLFDALQTALNSEDLNLHLSNGTTVRLAAAMKLPKARVWCNRGVSGIDGSTSTAVGTAIAFPFITTLLVTGDMSAAYDISALSNPDIPPTFKMIIRANGGGDIFRRIPATRHLDIVEPYLAAMPLFPIAEIARAYGFDFAETDLADVAADGLRDFINLPRKAILLVKENKDTE